MPRRPKFIHPLRTLRAFCGKSQVQFAEMLGVKEIAIRRIENGSLNLSPKLARVLMIQTGVDPKSLDDGGPLRSILPGLDYSAEVFSKYSQRRATQNPRIPVTKQVNGKIELTDPEREKEVVFMEGLVRILAMAAVRENRFYAVKQLCLEWVKETTESFKLGDAMNAIAVENGKPPAITKPSMLKRRPATKRLSKE